MRSNFGPDSRRVKRHMLNVAKLEFELNDLKRMAA